MTDAYKIGIEEEYFLVDAETKSVTRAMPEAFLAAAKKATNGQVVGEFLQSQVEVKTLPHTDIKTAHTELRHLRQTVARVAAEHGLAILAAGTHPTADWGKSQQSEGQRYDAVMDDLQMIGQRNMLCGLHVHVELPDPDDRVDLMIRMLPCRCSSRSPPRRRSGGRGRPDSRAIGSRPTTSCRAPACRNCCAPRRSSTPMCPRW
jgi:glutamate---cysteine ligase / carboxylate-amine ligase